MYKVSLYFDRNIDGEDFAYFPKVRDVTTDMKGYVTVLFKKNSKSHHISFKEDHVLKIKIIHL